jgi:5-methylcytosine-specific restriction protein B
MARWIGEDHISDVLESADFWRSNCFMENGSVFSDEELWIEDNIKELKQRISDDPFERTEKRFYEKLEVQLKDADAKIIRLAAEVVWFYLLFPHYTKFRPDTKLKQIKKVWGWSGTALPDATLLTTENLKGVGRPGIAYIRRRRDEIKFLLEVIENWKSLSNNEQLTLMEEDAPWGFVFWLDQISDAKSRPMRNAILYFLFPDELERSLTNDHRDLIVNTFVYKIPENIRPITPPPSLLDRDKIISAIRSVFEQELGTTEIDFYRPPIYEQWWDSTDDESEEFVPEDDLSSSNSEPVIATVTDADASDHIIFSEIETDEIPKDQQMIIEGETVEKKVLSYKRNSTNTKKCKKRDKYTCQACGFYHDDKIVECHHLKPLAMTKESVVTLEDLITLCPTCHRLAHALIDENYELYTECRALISKLSEIAKKHDEAEARKDLVGN